MPGPATPGRLYRHNWFSRSKRKSLKLWFLNGSREVGVCIPYFVISGLVCVASHPWSELKAPTDMLTLMRGLIEEIIRWQPGLYLTPSPHKFQSRISSRTNIWQFFMTTTRYSSKSNSWNVLADNHARTPFQMWYREPHSIVISAVSAGQ